MNQNYLSVSILLVFLIAAINRISGFDYYNYDDQVAVTSTLSVTSQVFDSYTDIQVIPEQLFDDPKPIPSDLSDQFEGETYSLQDLSPYTIANQLYSDRYEFQLMPQFFNLFANQILIGAFSDGHLISSVSFHFFHDNGLPLRDRNDRLIQHFSERRNNAHFFNMNHYNLRFAYARCRIKFQHNSTFDLNSLYFHCSRPINNTSSGNNPSLIIGPTHVTANLSSYLYRTTAICPRLWSCLWFLDDTVVLASPSTKIDLNFRDVHIGSRKLCYKALRANIFKALACLLIHVEHIQSSVCQNLIMGSSNWLLAGNLHIPRVFFSANYFPANNTILIAGGTHDQSTALSSMEFLQVDDGCLRLGTLRHGRMKHESVYNTETNALYLLGGYGSQSKFLHSAELTYLYGSMMASDLAVGRANHRAIMMGSEIFIVGGRTSQLGDQNISEFYFGDDDTLAQNLSTILKLEGHSIVKISRTCIIVISGTNQVLSQINETNITFGIRNLSITLVNYPYSNHQAVFLGNLGAVFISGGDNGTHVTNQCFLYFHWNRTLVSVASLHVPRTFHTATLLSNGSVLIVGGATNILSRYHLNPTNLVEMFDLDLSMQSSPPLNTARYHHRTVLTDWDGRIFTIGGIDSNRRILSSIEYLGQ